MICESSELSPTHHRALLLNSGGLDSTLVALSLRQRGVPTVALAYEYPNRPQSEKRAADALAARMKFVDRLSVPLPLSDYRGAMPPWLAEQAAGWIPYRNVIFLSMAAHLALFHGCNLIAAGIRLRDSDTFSDATRAFLGDIEALLVNNGVTEGDAAPRLYLPLIEGDDYLASLLAAGGEEAEILAATWSCWNDGAEPCGRCAPCIDRKTRFDAARAAAEAKRGKPV